VKCLHTVNTARVQTDTRVHGPQDSEASELGNLSTDRKTQILLTPCVFGAFIGVECV